MRRWLVVTPEYKTFSGSWDPPEPPEHGADCIEVEAETARDAVRLGVVEMLKGGKQAGYPSRYRYCCDQRSDGCSPYTGVKAEPVPAEEEEASS